MANAPVVPIVNKTQLSTLRIMIPDYARQCEFANFVKQVDKSKSEILEGIKRLNLPQIN